MQARSGREQQELARRMRPRGAGRSAGAVEDAGDVAWVCHNIEDTHATAAFAADGDGDGEDAGEQAGSADAARSGGRLGGRAPRVVVVESEMSRVGGTDRLEVGDQAVSSAGGAGVGTRGRRGGLRKELPSSSRT